MKKSKRQPLKGSQFHFFDQFREDQFDKAMAEEQFRVKLVLQPRKDGSVSIDRTSSFSERKRAFASHYGAREEDLQLVRKFAGEFNLDIKKINPTLGIVDLSGTAEALEQAFQVKLFLFEHKDERRKYKKKVLGYSGEVSLPEELAAITLCVIGLANIPHQHQAPAPEKTSEIKSFPAATGYPAQWFVDYYRFPEGSKGKGQRIAIIAGGGGFSQQDFDEYFKEVGLNPPVPIGAVVVAGPGNQPGSNWMFDYELATDCLVAAGAAPQAEITVYFTNDDILGFSDAVQQLVEMGEKAPMIISYSWGAGEDVYTEKVVNGVDRILQYAALVNQISFFCAAGDFGSINTYQPGSNPSLVVQYPASSPWVTSCGGTMFAYAGDGSITEERVWNSHNLYDLLIPNASGGGFSDYHSRPDYQQGVIAGSFPAKYREKRGVPDIAGHANISPASIGYWVRVDGQNWLSGGTSAVAPLWAALTARLNEARGRRLGFFNPLLYRMAGTGALREITNGNNVMPGGPPKFWTAGPGWDPCTGLGVPDGQAMLEWLRANA